MKLGLLAALAVVVLVPSLSEGRVVSRCELRDELGEALVLPRRLQRFKEKILATVICEANRKSGLNTGKVTVFGKRKTTIIKPKTVVTAAKPTTTKPTTTKPATTKPTTTKPATTEPTTTKPATTEPATTEPTTTKPTTTKPATTKPTTTEPTTTKPTTTEATMTEAATTEANTIKTTAPETTASSSSPTLEPGATNSTFGPNRTAGGVRRKRDVDKNIEESDETSEDSDETSEESDETELERSLDEMLNKNKSNFDEEEVVEDDHKMEDEDEDSDDEGEDEQGLGEVGKRKKRAFPHRWWPRLMSRPQSRGYYGLFQLSDKYFCNSGYRRSRNWCQTTCGAFTDDNITDDINCLVKTGHWMVVFRTAHRSCFCTSNFFDKCK